MGDAGIRTPPPPEDETLARLHKEEQFFECNARIVGLRKTIRAAELDIEVRKQAIAKADAEIKRLESHLETLGDVTPNGR